MASSLLIYNASKNQLKWLGTLEDLLDLLSSQLGIDSKDFQVEDNGTCLVLKVGHITCNFYTKANTLQIQGKENAEKLKLNLIELAKEKLPEKLFDEVPWPESEEQSGDEVIELESAAAKDPSRCCNNCSDMLEMFLLLRKDIRDLKEQVADFISKQSCIHADVCSHPDANINNELRHQQELNEKPSNNLHLEREEKQHLLQVNKDYANKLRLAEEEQKSLIASIHLLTKELETHRDSGHQKVLTAVSTDASAQAKSAYSSSATTTISTTTDRQREAGTDHREQSSHHTASSPQDPNHPERNASPLNSENNKPIVIIGDSIIKNIDPRRLSKKPVRKFTYPGKRADQISQEVTSINVSGDPAHIIVHGGTNNLPTDSAHRCAEKIVDLAKSVMLKFPNSRIAVSALTHREDLDLSANLHDVNENLKSLSESNNFTFIDHSLIDNSCLNSSKLHLNSKGSSLLAVKFINFIRSGSSRGPSSQARQGFRRSSVYNQLSKILLELANAPRRRSRDRHY